MDTIATPLSGAFIVKPKVFEDSRGWFFEAYHTEHFVERGLPASFVQDNITTSRRGVLRGLHYQLQPHGQAKLVRVLRGAAFDVIVDIRRGSPTLGQYFSIELSEENKTALYIPVGFAHGFYALADNTMFLYKCSSLYAPQYERSILWNDPTINIQWPSAIDETLISPKDREGKLLRDAEINFVFSA